MSDYYFVDNRFPKHSRFTKRIYGSNNLPEAINELLDNLKIYLHHVNKYNSDKTYLNNNLNCPDNRSIWHMPENPIYQDNELISAIINRENTLRELYREMGYIPTNSLVWEEYEHLYDRKENSDIVQFYRDIIDGKEIY